MEVKVEKKSEDPLSDILDAVLNLNEEDFRKATETVDDLGDYDEGLSFYYEDKKIEIPISVIFKYFDKSISNYEENSIQRKKIEEIIKSRNEEKSYNVLSSESQEGYLMVKKAFEILRNEELFEKFLNFETNKEDFKLPGVFEQASQNIQNYLRVMISIFGNIDKQGEIVNTSPILDDFYIQNIDKYKQKLKELYKYYEPQLKEETRKLKCRFTGDINGDIILHEEPEWQLNEEIKVQILGGMPEEMSPEEKAIFIYNKMCKTFSYDQGYAYRNQKQGRKINYTAKFSKEHLEAITPESKITCFDFSRIYKKIIDGLDEQMTAEIISQGGHFYIGLATENCQATLEAINITNKGRI